MTVRMSDLIVAVRDTLDESRKYPNGVVRDTTTLSAPDLKLARYAQRALGEKKQNNPAVFYRNPSYNAFEIPLANELRLQEYLNSFFPLPPEHLHEIALRVCIIYQSEGTEISDPSQAQVLREEAAAADRGTS